MHELVYKILVETALFMHGENQNEPELRGPSIRGLLRYWFRSALWSTKKVDIKQIEENFWGSSEHPGLIQIRIENKPLPEKDKFLLPHKDEKYRGKKKAIFYGDNMRDYPKLIIKTPKDDENAVEKIKATVFLSCHLGGFGQRARRGAGGILFMGPENEKSEKSPLLCNGHNNLSIEEFKQHLIKGLKDCNRIFNITNTVLNKNSNDKFPKLFSSEIYIANIEGKNEEDCRKNIMLELRKFKDPAWGLPLISMHINGRCTSPVWFKLTKIKNEWACVITRFDFTTGKGNFREIDTFFNNGVNKKLNYLKNFQKIYPYK